MDDGIRGNGLWRNLLTDYVSVGQAGWKNIEYDLFSGQTIAQNVRFVTAMAIKILKNKEKNRSRRLKRRMILIKLFTANRIDLR